MEWLDWDDDSDFWSAWDDYEPQPSGQNLKEFIVSMNLVDRPNTPKVMLYVFARNYEDALTCGEVLSAVYFDA